MTTFEIIIVCIASVSAIIYVAVILAFYYGWKKLPFFEVKESASDNRISIVVAARNEEKLIKRCLSSLSLQKYPRHLYEVIVVDDNSEDNTKGVITNFINDNPEINIRLLMLSDIGKIGKKRAVEYAVENAEGNLILTTDADCEVGQMWLNTYAAFYSEKKSKMICGPVSYYKRDGFFQKFQLLDFQSLIISTAGAIGINKPFMANAANMAFEKDVFINLLSSRNDYGRESGDDVFLLHGVKNDYPDAISYVKSPDALVYTEPKESLEDLINQRLRWASKAKDYSDFHASFFAAVILDYNFSFVALFFLSLFNTFFILPLAILYFIKSIVDLPLIYCALSFINRKETLKHYLWIQLLYPFYIVYTGFYALFSKTYFWKGRKVS